ncbi:acetyl/propionyl/methylcrotonyl-CoA carboxylase subunit alpha [Blastococcus saxobsidens]|uniref:Biotin-dependent acyl-coenzyme A carboxylase alpha3 subunit n=1 Tax=Blastococcus saxobsidens (strain DD2) TaxID=1146883 RepID=H6RL13_BLASD|nr:biotin carboxylase N-terminal domain-containing protein [Blastococcus saxobsidens]CCG04980.1 Acetyl-/propionyl-coenzyme A carboxylase alpha chain [Includes: Biotin carboxylase; Biotin carboxyl carrier protein] [Blastococcus saxobsidens DD2]
MQKVLIANRGEIAVRVARACKDAGLTSVAVYAEPDRDALHVRVADEAFALGGTTPGDSYLVIDKILDAAKQSGADAIHPGYGFLSENADFAQAVLDAGLTWIGPSPQAIIDLGDKVAARHIATRAGAPLVPGTKDPVGGADEVVAFAKEHGLPVAIKAAFGGGGRGLKVARTIEEIPELFDSAVREAVSAFGRGECFVERFLDKPRHVEAQVLADTHGNVIVVGTRDCSLQRRNQKLVEEAPAPFLTDEQRDRIHSSAKAICAEAGYHGAGTVEYLVGTDGSISFLEVNTRLQVEHPVSEETSGIDLVRQQFRIADGLPLEITEDPEPRGHSIEFRINAEDAGRNFMPAPGPVDRLEIPQGPGVRWDSGVETGGEVAGAFDSMLAKLIVTGATREEALQRARRALDELVVEGMPTVIPFHRAVVRDEAFTSEPFTVHTRWIETEWHNQVQPYAAAPAEQDEDAPRQTVVVEVGGRRLEVSLPAGLAAGGGAPAGAAAKPRRRGGGGGGAAASGDSLTSPMQGTIVKVAVEDGATVAAGDLVVVLEAMKMEQPITAHKAGTVSGLSAEVGATVTSGAVLCTIADPE